MNGRIILVCIFIFTGLLLNAQVTWQLATNLPAQTRGAHAGFAIDNSIYIGTGFDAAINSYYKDLWEYNTITLVWTQKADIPGNIRYAASGFSINGYGYIGLGWNPSTFQLNDFYKFDPVSNTWTSISPFPPGGRYTSSTFVIGNDAYVGTGYIPLQSDFWKYNSTIDAWTQISSVPGSPRQSAIGFEYNGIGFLCTGATSSAAIKDLIAYNPNTNLWTVKTPLPGPGRYGAFTFRLCDRIFIGCGSNFNGTMLNDVYSYDPANDSWLTEPAFPTNGMRHSVGFSLNNIGYVTCGIISSTNAGSTAIYKLNLNDHSIVYSSTPCDGVVSFSTTTTNAQNYTWYFGDGTSGNAPAVAHTYTQAGTYHVQLIVNHLCFSDTTDTWVTVNTANSMNAQFSYLLDTCASTLHFTPNDTLNTHLWDFGDGNTSTATSTTHTYASHGSFVVTHSVYNACDTLSVIMPVVLNQMVPVVAQFEVSIDTCSSQLNFINTSVGGTQHVWYIGMDTMHAYAPQLTVTESGNFPITLVTIYACFTDSVFLNYHVPVLANINLFIPNAFSPNDDGMNDFFKINNNDVCNPYKILIFNRWGEKIYDATSAHAPWDGRYKSKPCPAGLYYYAVFFNNEVKRGPVMLLK